MKQASLADHRNLADRRNLANHRNPWLQYLPVGVTALFAFLCFDQGFDMKITMLHASELIRAWLGGQPFYALTWTIAEHTGYLGYSALESGAIYNIVIYLTMAVWAAPVYLLNHIFHFPNYVEILNLWGRVLVIGLCLVTSGQMAKLAGELFPRDRQEGDLPWERDVRYLFLSSPILLYEAIVFNQYDIFMILTMVIALRLYFKNRMVLFSLVMALSVCYKLFAVLILFPLLLLKEKRLGRILGYSLLGVSLYGLTTLACTLLDPGYSATQSIMGAHFHYGTWIFEVELPGGFSGVYAFVLGYVVLCFLAFLHHPGERKTEFTLWLCLAVYVLFFCFVNWHPQWVVLLVPFISLLFASVRQREAALLADLVLSVGYLLVNIFRWMHNCFLEETIFRWVFRPSFPRDMNPLKDLMLSFGVEKTLLMTVMEAGMLLFLIAAWRGIRGRHPVLEYPGNGRWVEVLFRARSLVLFLFTLPPIVQLLLSQH